tara:strand:- start:479 stop:859 length:381 start_codon:yes stop_codon:yes gene_type:complete
MKKIKNTNRSFGILFFIVFLIIGLWPLKASNEVAIWAVVLSAIFLILGLLNSRFLTPINKLWIKLGQLIGKFVAPIFLGIIFFTVLTPIGILLKIFKKDILSLKFDKKINSYWKKRDFKILFKKQY